MEAEFIALSSAMHDLIPPRQILQSIGKVLKLPVPSGTLLKSAIFEDNMGCLQLATVPKMTPHSKHIAVKYFWFHLQVGPDKGITIVKCDTKDMLADIFTKGLAFDQFAVLRELLMGWTSAREGVSLDKPMSSGLMSYLHSYVQKYMHAYMSMDAPASTDAHGAVTSS